MSAAATATIRTQVETALALRASGRLEEALAVLDAPGQYSSDYYTVRGEIQLALGRFQEAAGSYFTVVASEPENVYARFNLAVCLQRLQRWGEAAQAFQAVLELDPHRDDARLLLAASLLHLNRLEEALTNFDRCWSESARQQALFGKAVALQLLGRHDDAEADYRRLLELEPNSPEALANLIALCIQDQNWEGAKQCAARLLDIAPQSIVALQALAAVALERREYEAAVQYCGRIVERAPDCLEAWHNLRYATGRVMSALHSPSTSAPKVFGR